MPGGVTIDILYVESLVLRRSVKAEGFDELNSVCGAMPLRSVYVSTQQHVLNERLLSINASHMKKS